MSHSPGGLPATVPDHLQVIRPLGSGGMGSVYLVRDTRLHRQGALKVIREEHRDDPAMRELFVREARLSARLQHPGIVPVYDFCDDPAGPWQLFRYLDAETLGDRLRRDGALAPDLCRRLLTDLADTLAYAHGAGVVHRDLKPDNILLDGPAERPRPVIADFGVALRSGLDHGPGERRLQFGTPWYMAPEQAAGDHDVDGRADLFSLGVIGYHMLTGAVPHDGPSAAAVAAAAATGQRIPLAERAPGAPVDLVAVIERCLAADPAGRWQRADAVRDALAGAEPGRVTPTPRPATPARRAPAPADSPTRPITPRRMLAMPFTTEIRVAVRSLRRSPAVTIAALVCLALGIGATTAIFSAVHRALLAPLPFRDPAGLVSVFRTTPHFSDGPFSPANVIDLTRESRTLRMAALTGMTGFLEREDGSDRVSVMRASGDLFTILGAQARAGRLLTAEDGEPGAPPAAVLSDEAWRSRFGADPTIAGQTIRLNGRPVTVVGVLPPRFSVPAGAQLLRADLWIPLVFDSAEAAPRRSNYLRMVARLEPGRSLAQASTEMDGLMNGLIEAFPDLKGEGIRLAPLQAESRRAIQEPLLMLLAAVAFVLLIAASNVASLLLARGAERHREVAIRSALGAARGDIIRKVLLEAGVLVGGGTALGLLLAWLGVRVIGAMAAVRQPQLAGLSLNGPVVAFAVALAVIVAVGCGVIPAVRSARVDPQTTLRSGDQRAGGSAGRHRFLRSLATAEVALSVVLLLGAGLVIRGFRSLLDQPTGFDQDRILTAVVTLDGEKYRDTPTVDRFLTPALAAIEAQPGIRGAASINLIPYDNWGSNFNIRYEGQEADDPTRLPLVESRTVSRGFFATMGIPLVSGRFFADEDADPEGPVNVVVNEALAARDFAGRNPIGARFHRGRGLGTIVGVVRDIRNFGPSQPPQPEMYYLRERYPDADAGFSLVIRADGDPATQAAAVRAAIRTVDPTAAVSLVRSMREIIDTSVGRPRFYAVLLGAFAAVAVLLAVAGLYGLMSYLVAQRTREIGIRMALGSTPARTRAMVLAQGGRLVGVGLVIGLLAAVWLTRLISRLLYGVSPLDPVTWGAAILVLGATATAALMLPARRATRVDPLRAIRSD